jgi:hypothetical protein
MYSSLEEVTKAMPSNSMMNQTEPIQSLTHREEMDWTQERLTELFRQYAEVEGRLNRPPGRPEVWLSVSGRPTVAGRPR